MGCFERLKNSGLRDFEVHLRLIVCMANVAEWRNRAILYGRTSTDFFKRVAIIAQIDQEQGERRKKELYMMQLLWQVNIAILEEISADD